MDLDSERIRILERIESGEITAEQGIELLRELDQRLDTLSIEDGAPENAASREDVAAPGPLPEPGFPPPVETVDSQPGPEIHSSPPPPSEFEHARRFWWIPVAIGVGVTVISGLLMLLAWQGSGFGFWFACTWFPFLIGVALIALGWASRQMRWLHLRIDQQPGEWPQRIAFSFPLPLGLAAWGARTFGSRIPSIQGMPVEQMITALENTSPDAPFYMDVDDDEDGEHVQIVIG